MTCELALWPEHASFERADFDWRISTARIEESGPFSEFPGFERILVITEGEGVLLEHGRDAPRSRLRRFEPYRFSGDWKTNSELLRGPVADFNLLARRGKFDAQVMALALGARPLRESIGSRQALLHVLDGALIARVSGEEDPFAMARGDSLLISDCAAGDELDLAGQDPLCSVVLVRIAAIA